MAEVAERGGNGFVAEFPPGTTLGVVADTHVRDRASRLPDQVLDVFHRAGVRAILHAGDVTSRGVLEALERVAPVYAVRGNLDVFLKLPMFLRLRLGPYHLVLAHGHHGLLRYLKDKVHFHLGRPLSFWEIETRTRQAFPKADIIVLGHTHAPVLRREEGVWIFNPGSPTVPPGGGHPDYPRTVGLIHLDAQARLTFEFVFLRGD